MNPIIEIKQLNYVYGAGTPFQRNALRGIDLSIYPGEYLGIIGHTGSGKSTLIQHLNGLLKPTSGTVCFNGMDIWSDKTITRRVRFQVGLVFQYPEYQLFEESVYKDIAFGPTNMKLDRADVDRRVRRAAEFVGLGEEMLDRSPFELSGGQKRRVAIAGVIAMEPEVLVLDEPTAGLDPEGREELLDNLRAYHDANHAAIVLVSHSMEEIARNVDRLAVIHQGEMPIQGTPGEVFAQHARLREMGLDVPQVTTVVEQLRRLGLTLPDDLYTVDAAAAAIQNWKEAHSVC